VAFTNYSLTTSRHVFQTSNRRYDRKHVSQTEQVAVNFTSKQRFTVISTVPPVLVINTDLCFLLVCIYLTLNQNRKLPSLQTFEKLSLASN